MSKSKCQNVLHHNDTHQNAKRQNVNAITEKVHVLKSRHVIVQHYYGLAIPGVYTDFSIQPSYDQCLQHCKDSWVRFSIWKLKTKFMGMCMQTFFITTFIIGRVARWYFFQVVFLNLYMLKIFPPSPKLPRSQCKWLTYNAVNKACFHFDECPGIDPTIDVCSTGQRDCFVGMYFSQTFP
jgi:hypothetical protein